MTGVNKKRVSSGALAGLCAAALLLAGTSPAHAEGSFESFINQAQAGFTSRTWTDSRLDSTPTKITLSACALNKGGAKAGSSSLNSVGVSLYRDGKYVRTISKKCGVYDFGNPGKGTYHFRIEELNGKTAIDGRTFFLNVGGVKVQY